MPAGHDCKACRFAGKQKFKEDVCFLTGGTCKKYLQGGVVILSQTGRNVYLLWTACQSQWRIGVSGPIGLDYPAVKLVADTFGIEWTERLLKHIQALEGATLSHFAEKAKTEAAKK